MNTKPLMRGLIYATLLLAALFFLAPLYVMLVTSFKMPRKSAMATCRACRMPEPGRLAPGVVRRVHRHRLPRPDAPTTNRW